MGRSVMAITATLVIFVLSPFGSTNPSAVALPSGDGTCGEPSTGGSTRWYFAEGYTGEGFQEYLVVFNPAEGSTDLRVAPLFNHSRQAAGAAAEITAASIAEPSSEAGPFDILLPGRARLTLDINSLVGADMEVSLYLESGSPVVAERPMYFAYRGAWKGCTVTSGTESPSKSWYFAEGCTREGFETWILLANPGEEAAQATVWLILEDGSTHPSHLDLPPLSRRTLFVNQAVGGGRDVGARVEADKEICAERVMYFHYHGRWPGGHASSGLGLPRRTYLFPEGYTGNGFEEWLTLYAPRETSGPDGAIVDLNCLFEGGEERAFDVRLEPDRRYTLNVNQLVGEGRNVSLELASDEPFLAERPMYFNYAGVCRGGHVSKGVAAAESRWWLAEGTIRGGFHTYLCIMNPDHRDAEVEVDCVFGGETSTGSHLVPGRSRLTVRVQGPLLPSSARRTAQTDPYDVSFGVRSSVPIAVERPVYHPGSSFEVANAMDHIRNLSVNLGQRVEGTAGEAAAAEYIAAVLRGYGYSPTIQEVPLPNGGITRNVIAETNPLTSPDSVKVLFVGGHYDTKAGTGSPGANDNASGTAVVLELARCFAEMENSQGVALKFVLFGGEERLVEGTDLHHFGSRHYVQSLTQWEREHAIGAIVVDMVGVGGQLYARTMGIGPMDLCNRLMAYARDAGISLPYLVSGSYSDHEPFEKAGIPAVWLEYKDDPWYHTPGDSYEKINPSYMDNTGRLLEGFIRSRLVRGD